MCVCVKNIVYDGSGSGIFRLVIPIFPQELLLSMRTILFFCYLLSVFTLLLFWINFLGYYYYYFLFSVFKNCLYIQCAAGEQNGNVRTNKMNARMHECVQLRRNEDKRKLFCPASSSSHSFRF